MKVKGRKKTSRIRHDTTGTLIVRPTEEAPPRGWIHPNGKFFESVHHWQDISKYLKLSGADDPDQGERNAHVAYARGWISLGHGGAFNAIGHEKIFSSPDAPAIATLRKQVAKVPHFALRVEKQIGEIDLGSGRHEDFDVAEYDLEVFIRRGRLRRL